MGHGQKKYNHKCVEREEEAIAKDKVGNSQMKRAVERGNSFMSGENKFSHYLHIYSSFVFVGNKVK